jgi:hypothetical protein
MWRALGGSRGLAPRWRQRLVSAAIAGSVLVLSYAIVQTLAGRGRFDAPPPIATLLVAGGVLLAVPWFVVAVAWGGGLVRRRLTSVRG